MFKIFRFLKIVKVEHELLKECFEELKSINFHSLTNFISETGRVLTESLLYHVCFLYSYYYMYKNKTKNIV